MGRDFKEHPRKRTVRENWNTPLLRLLRDRWACQYLYFGLPGPKALDIKLWKDMIQDVVAFELMDEKSTRPRKRLEALARELTLLNLKHTIYCGPLEDVVLRGEDDDGKTFSLDEFVTLYNLDFCGAITERILVRGEQRCLRFEAVRAVTSLQRQLYRKTGASRFVLLMTMRNEFHGRTVSGPLNNEDLPEATQRFLRKARGMSPVMALRPGIKSSTSVLRTFVFTSIRETLQGQNIVSVFLPPLIYQGSSAQSPMIHFAVVCEMGAQEVAFSEPLQTAEDFCRLRTVRATNSKIEDGELPEPTDALEIDPVAFLEKYPSLVSKKRA